MFNFVFNRLSAAIGIMTLSPLLVFIAIAVAIDSKGGVLYIQERIGKGGEPFGLFKFRTMRVNADREGKLTVGDRDPRITRVGYYLRKYKVDELPQLFNVLIGTMNLVGPRPEVKEYVELYTPDQRRVLDVRPGITDYASLKYFKESELLAASPDPRKTYVDEIMPEKLRINLMYIDRRSMREDLTIIAKTVGKILG